MKWNDESKDSPLLCGIIEDNIKIYPNFKEIRYKGFLTRKMIASIEEAMKSDAVFRKYSSPVGNDTVRLISFFGLFTIHFSRPVLINGWVRV